MLAFIGAFQVASWLAHIAFRNTAVAEVPDVREVRSPNDQYRAVLQTWAGGGGLSPYCQQAILVVPVGINLANVHDTQSYEVYSGSECDSFAAHSPSPEITWDGDRTLKVRVSINRTAMTEQTFRLRKRDASGAVSIKFSADE
ncbi:hypothetical protein [Paraburkholderia sacchari]|uniref:hypothetical protein n=1 Tax=Paraburkholderia sacchari TaxID=159450 RepID=UPI0039A5E2C0